LLPGTYDFVLTVTDDRFGESSDTVRIVVRDAISDLSQQIAACSASAGGGASGEILAALGTLSSKVDANQLLLSNALGQMAAKDAQLQILQAQVMSLQEQVDLTTHQLVGLREALTRALSALETNLEQSSRTPSFTIPGDDELDKVEALVDALLQQSRGAKKDLVETMTGR
jgi:hypothetical protein